MTPELSDYLTKLLAPSNWDTCTPELAWGAFIEFIQKRDIEYCNSGAFEFDANGKPVFSFLLSNMPGAWISEYNERHFDTRDYALKRSNELTSDQPFATIPFGEWLVPHLPEPYQDSDEVLRGAGDAGMNEAVALVGKAPLAPGSAEGRFFAFGFGGKPGSANRIKSQQDELMVASFALLHAMKGRYQQAADGIKVTLTGRETDVLSGFACGDRRDVIAFKLGISMPTVDMHAMNVRRKLKAQTLSEAVAKGYRYGLL